MASVQTINILISYITKNSVRKLFFFFLLFSVKASAQTGTIEGFILDKTSNAPLNNVTITIPSLNKSETSDELGNFSIKSLMPGNYQLVISSIGYKPVLIDVQVTENKTSKINACLNNTSLNLSEVVITGRKTPALTTIASIDIKLRPVNTSQDVLRIVPGLFIAQHAGGGKADQLFLRGYDIDHGTDVAETVDGIPVNMVSHAHGQGYADLHFIIPETIDKINFDKGPYQTDKGNFATAGWIDFKTKDFLTSNSIKVEAGQFNYKRVLGLVKLLNKERNNSRQQIYIGTEYFTGDSYFDDPQDFHRLNLFAKYSAVYNSNAQLFITASAFDSKWNASGQIPDRAVKNGMITRFGAIDNSEGGNTSRANLNARFIKHFGNDFKTINQIYFSNYHFNLFSNFTFFLNDPVNGDGIQQKENRNLFGYHGIISKEYFTRHKKASSELGYGFRSDLVRNSQLNHVIKRNFLGHIERGDINETNGFVHFNQNFEINDKLTANAGLRYEHFHFAYKNIQTGVQAFRHQTKSALLPKLNFSYTVSKKLRIGLNTGIGIHSNDTRVILDKHAKDILPKVYGTDLSIFIKPAKALLLKTTFWHLYSQQEFVYVGDEGIVEPSGKTRRIGIDFSGRYQPLHWLYIDLDINAAKPRSIEATKGNDYVPLAPVFTSIGGITVKTRNGFSGSLRYRQMNKRPANEDNAVKAQGYFIADVLTNYGFKKFELSLSVENLLNKEWREAQFDTRSRLQNETLPVSEIHYTPGTTRFIKLGLTFNF